MRTTILGGVLFLAPVAVLAIILGKVFQISMQVVEPLDNLIPVESLAGVATLNILAIMFILLVCYVAGLLARRAFLNNRLRRVDDLLIDLIPGYAVFKSLVGSASSDEALTALMQPVLARFDDYEQIAFMTEEGEDRSVLFLPGSPSAWSGTAVIVDNARITKLDLPAHQAARLLRTFGRGSLAATRGDAPKTTPDPA